MNNFNTLKNDLIDRRNYSTEKDNLIRIKLSGSFDCYATITLASFQELEIALGNTIWASVKATELNVLPNTIPAKT